MKLDRNENMNGHGKYALLKLRNMPAPDAPGREAVDKALTVLRSANMLDTGEAKTEAEFFVIRLKDKYAQQALAAYAREAVMDDVDYGGEVWELARRAGTASPWCKKPD